MIRKAFRNDTLSAAQISLAETLQRWSRVCWKWSTFWKACNKQNTWECWMCTGCDQWRLVAFPKTKITFEREELSDLWWDSGRYDRVTDGDWENCVRSQGAYFEGDWGIIVLCMMFLISRIFFKKCLYFSYYLAGYLLDRPCVPVFEQHRSVDVTF